MRHPLLATLLVCALLLIMIQPVAAHANLEYSDPPAGALLQHAPKEIVIGFSEDLDPGFSAIRLLTSKNEVVHAGPGTIDPAAPRVMRLPLGALPNDSYTALWRVRSATDGHITEGSVPFGVGVAATTPSLLPAPATADPATAPPPPLESVVRWLNFLFAAVALGGLPFALFVWRPAFRHIAGDTARRADDALTRGIRRCIRFGGGAFVLCTALFLLTQTASAAGVALTAAIGQPLVRMLASHTEQVLGARILLTLLILALSWRMPSAGGGRVGRWWALLALGGLVVLTFSLNAHGAAEQHNALFAVAADWLHVAAMIAWLGGLVPLLATVRLARRDTTMPLRPIVGRFSLVAGICVAVLILSGVYSASLHIGRADLLTTTSYGWALVAKIALFAVLILIGAVNLAILAPRLRRSATGTALTRTVRVELVLGGLLLLAVGAMMSLAPSVSAWEQHERQGFSETVIDNDVTLTLRVAPVQIGDNEWAVDVDDRRSNAHTVPATILLRYTMQGMAMGTLQVEAPYRANERYLTRGSYTSMGGRWNVEVVLRRPGFDDVRHVFVIDVVHRSAPF